jgi:hypothetical protein
MKSLFAKVNSITKRKYIELDNDDDDEIEDINDGDMKNEVKKAVDFFTPTPPRYMISPTSIITYNEKNHKFSYNGTNIPGLLKLLKKCFFPNYSYEKAIIKPRTFGPSFLPPFSPHPSVKTKNGGSITPHQRMLRGINRGKRIDRRIKILLELQRLYNLPDVLFVNNRNVKLPQCRQFILNSATTSMSKKQLTADAKKLRTLLNTKESHIRQIWQKLIDKSLTWKQSQIPVGNMYFGTCLDGILFDIKNRIIPIEIKTGMENTFKNHTSENMKYPFEDQNDSLEHQAYLQVAIGTELHKLNNPTQEWRMAGISLVIRATQDHTEFLALPDWCTTEKCKIAIEILNKAAATNRRS